MLHDRLHLHSKQVVSQHPRISFNIITSNMMYPNAGTKMHREVAALIVVHYIPSKLVVIFSKTTNMNILC